jgi:signal transduction histidine kinase/ActR/RegA family two-component response regulator
MSNHSASPDDRVFIVAPIGRDAELACGVLERFGIDCDVCPDVEVLCEHLSGGAGATLIAEEALVEPALGTLKKVLSSQPPWSSLPLIVLTREAAQARTRTLRQLGSLSAVTFLERPVRIMTLVSSVRTAVEARRRQYEIRHLLNRLEQAVQQRDEFLAMLSHELRNPLAAIRSASDLLRALQPTEPVLARVSDILGRQTGHLTALVDDLLDVARVTSGKITLRRQPVEMRRVVEDSLAGVRPMFERRNHGLDVRLPNDPAVVYADPARMKQIVDNLLSNAAKYTPPGGHVELSADVCGDTLQIRVLDNGVGMSSEMLGRVFELFAQADRNLDRSEGGLGVGLTVARRLAEMHGGRITAWSEGLGRGSEFTLHLPMHADDEDSVEDAGHPALLAKEPRLRILIVEDNADAAESLALLLEMLGHEVRTVHDGESALATAHEYQPEAVLLDIGLPGIDGYEVARRLRTDPSCSHARLIAVSGYGLEADRRRARDSGFDGHVIKPVEANALRTLLSESDPVGNA